MPEASWKDGAGVYQESATIADGGTTSGAVDLKGGVVVGVHVPTGFDGTSLTFQAGDDAGTYRQVMDDAGVAVTLVVTATKFVQVPPALLAGLRRVKLVAGTQTGATTLFVAIRPPY